MHSRRWLNHKLLSVHSAEVLHGAAYADLPAAQQAAS